MVVASAVTPKILWQNVDGGIEAIGTDYSKPPRNSRNHRLVEADGERITAGMSDAVVIVQIPVGLQQDVPVWAERWLEEYPQVPPKRVRDLRVDLAHSRRIGELFGGPWLVDETAEREQDPVFEHREEAAHLG